MRVKELMTSNVVTVAPEATLKDVGKLLKEKRISGVPVVDHSGSVIGVVTLTDMFRILEQIYKCKATEREMSLSEAFDEKTVKGTVYDIMTKNVLTLSETDTIEDVMRLMFTNKVHTIPVTRDGKLIGVVGKRDLVYACF